MIFSKQIIHKSKYIPVILLSPGLLILTLGYFIPLIMLFVISFYKGVPGSGLMVEEFTTGNYLRLFDAYYVEVLLRTFKIAIYTTILSLVLGYPVAVVIARSTGKIKSILLAIVLVPLLTNVVARTLGLMIILGRHGPVNQLLDLLGVPKINFIPGELGIIVGLTQVFMPYMILSISSVLSNIDFSLEGAARDLGSSKFEAFWKVTFPLSMSGIVAGSLFVFLLSFSSYVTPRLLGGGKVMVITMLIYQQAMLLLNWPFAAAVAVILLILSIVLVTFYTKATTSSKLIDTTVYGDFQKNHFSFQDFFRKINDWRYDRVTTARLAVDVLTQKSALIRVLATLGLYFGKFFIKTWKIFIVLFIIVPLPLVILSSFSASSMITFPPTGYSIRWYTGIFERMEYVRSFLLSLRLSLLCVIISVSVGTLASLALARYNFRCREIIRSVFLSPLMLPAVIVGLALLRFFASIRWVATFQGILLAHLILTTAYVVRTVSSSLVGFDNSLEEAARDLGASSFYTLRKVTLPLIKPGLIVAAIFAFIVSFDETTVSIFITGGRTITLPVRIFSQLEYGLDPTVTAISSLLILMAVIALFIIGEVFGLDKFSIK
ncbi:MAG: ABC transporter permease subunit [Candidatus Atribacteria bacterium]|nr:ABC transporter permease subunit [Candidatus Atribacteria bacterium]